jgi:hypothetical protein
MVESTRWRTSLLRLRPFFSASLSSLFTSAGGKRTTTGVPLAAFFFTLLITAPFTHRPHPVYSHYNGFLLLTNTPEYTLIDGQLRSE